MPVLTIRLIGDVTVALDGVPIDVGSAKTIEVLTALVLDADRPTSVSIQELVDRVWGNSGDTPATANNVYGYIAELRRVLGADAVVTKHPGYHVVIAPQDVDVLRIRTGIRAFYRAELTPDAGLPLIRLWRHRPFPSLVSNWFAGQRAALTDEFLAFAVELLANAPGIDPTDRLTEARALYGLYPDDPGLLDLLVGTLITAGKRPEAARAFDRHQRRTGRHDLSPAEQATYARLTAVSIGPAPVPQRVAVPEALPSRPGRFLGRADLMRRLDRMRAGAVAGSAPAVALLTGAAGTGKSHLAIHWAYRNRASFPDGQLYTDLSRTSVLEEILDGLLIELGVRPADLPIRASAKVAVYARETRYRRLLIVLDNADSAAQIEILVPPSGGHFVLVTSRSRLPGLDRSLRASEIAVPPLFPDDAVALLEEFLPGHATGQQRAALRQLAARCRYLPEPLVVAGARIARSSEALDTLVADDVEPDDVFARSYRSLPTSAARAFRLLAVHPAPVVPADDLAVLTGSGIDALRADLAILESANLVEPIGSEKYRLPGLLLAYARGLTEANQAETETARTRLFDRYTTAAVQAAETAAGPAAPAALAWLTEHRGLLLLIAESSTGDHALDLSRALLRPLDGEGRHSDAARLHRAAVTAAGQDLRLLAETANNLGHVQIALGDLGDAERTLIRARDAADSVNDAREAGRAYSNLGRVATLDGRLAEALLLHDQAVVLLADDPLGSARARTNRAGTLKALGRLEDAESDYRQALEIASSVGNREAVARAAGSLGLIHDALGRHSDALAWHQQAHDEFAALDDRLGAAIATTNIGTSLAMVGHAGEAVLKHRDALHVFRSIGNRRHEAETLNNLGRALLDCQLVVEARDAFEEAITVATVVGRQPEVARANLGLARVERRYGSLSRASLLADTAMGMMTALTMPEALEARALWQEINAERLRDLP